ncbi:MAG: T9SS type A sorting domain-containing protein, partial [Candidatus Kryptoniota bacterium]
YALSPTVNSPNYPQPGTITAGDALKVFLGRYGGSQPLNSGYEVVAADVNGDQRITSGDALAILKRATGTFPDFRKFGKGDWIFINSDFAITKDNAFTADTSRLYNNLSSDKTNQNFIGVIVGDANGSYGVTSVAAHDEYPSVQSENAALVEVPDQTVNAKTTEIRVPIDLNLNNGEFDSVDLTIAYDSTRLGIRDVNLGPHLSPSLWTMDWNVPQPGKLRIASISIDGAAIDRPLNLLTVKFFLRRPVCKQDTLNVSIPMALLGKSGDEIRALTRPGKVSFVESVTKGYSLEQNYPNPFNSSTVIRYEIPKDEYVSLKIYDILGQAVCTLVEGMQLAGSYTAQWDGRTENGNTLPSGIYLCRLIAGGFTFTDRMVFLK